MPSLRHAGSRSLVLFWPECEALLLVCIALEGMGEPYAVHAQRRLLLLLSDGKPSDIDNYEGRYGTEDMRQAIIEADWQGISPFCLTIDRHAAQYLPQVFGSRCYALLPNPELLPTVLLDWMRRLAAA